MSKSKNILTLTVNIDSPKSGSTVEGSSVTVSGTASAHVETIAGSPGHEALSPLGPVSEPKPSVTTVDDGPLPDELIFPSPGSADGSFTDVTAQITNVQVKIGSGDFEPATATGDAGRQWETWTFQGALPQVFKTITITARVVLGTQSESSSIQVSRLFKKVGSLIGN
jgi:hypothetical protein